MNETHENPTGAKVSYLSPGQLAQIACLLEVTARKPGNVHRFRDSADLQFLDFLLSAAAIGPALDRASREGVGSTVLAAVESTRQVVSTNTNLGMILLLAPLAAVPKDDNLTDGVERVLSATTVEDARGVYQAIRLAAPGGLGLATEQDVASEPAVTLREAMAMAADRDMVARQYANGFLEVLKEALPIMRLALEAGQALEIALITTFLGILARHPDSLIVRKFGIDRAGEVTEKAAAILVSGWPVGHESKRLIEAFDAWLRAEGNRLNPGTTADLVTAALFAALRDGTISLPRPAGPINWSGL
jgi:triphosphoribosyl-dephospho-CoA synthase